MRTIPVIAVLVVLTGAPSGALAQSDRAVELARGTLMVDTHIDVPYRLREKWSDVTRLTEDGEFDYVRARAGGLDVPFMSIYTPATYEAQGKSRQAANELIDSVEALAARAPDRFEIVTTPIEALRARNAGRIGLALGMENGSPLEGDLANIRYFRDRGISYITLTHSLANHISDSSFDPDRPNQGLSEFGRQTVAEMNRAGIMVDISHVSDATFWQVLEVSRVPVIASHSSARHFTPGFERNMSDEMIRALAARGGVIMINFGSSFITEEANQWHDDYAKQRNAWVYAHHIEHGGAEAREYQKKYREKHPFPFADLADVVAHYEHVIDIAGIDHVGIGSDFDGVGDSLPVGLKDVSAYPNLVVALLENGRSEEDIAKILGGNLMRVWGQAAAYAEEAAAAP